MTIDEIKSYFQDNFYVERLTSKAENKNLIKAFEAPKKGIMLEWYLHQKAWNDDLEGETKVYLIKDKNDFLVAFFSIKCGLLYDSHEYEKLKGDELEFVNLVIEQYEMNLSDKDDIIQAYYVCYEQITDERKDKLLEIAYQRYYAAEEERTSNDGRYIKRVHETFSAMEIAHFCKNIHYKYNIDDMQGVSLGAGLFWEKIIPKIKEAICIVGCKYLYLFAADNSDYEQVRSLIRYYKDDFKFDEIQGLMIIKPDYDSKCQAMIQDVSEIERDSIAFWARY
ncbi:MAG: hypothetical protein NC433_13495 [Clostridiales bacterium]|nr:hypothetical protein [Clostridiales bacterium]